MIRPDETSETSPCPSCRGLGVKLRTSRRALFVAQDGSDQRMDRERECLDCLGEGRVEGSGR